jgi:TonB-dependent SusC/RagA subfamily outer membrane receptor
MKIVLLNLLLLISLYANAGGNPSATDKKITGKVLDSKDASPLPGVNVLIKGTGIGTSTDASGNYEINVPNESSVLVFSFVGFTSQEIAVGNQSVVDVNLATDAKALTEVVVIGYGTVRKSDLTGAVATIKGEELMDKPVPNVSQALQGKIAGVEVSVNSNAPGAAAKVRVRGIGSINSNIDPLYVVDGVIGVDGNSINPNDIASLEVLKDASSTAIYGARGANGVIMITTKRGRAGGMKVSLPSCRDTEFGSVCEGLQRGLRQWYQVRPGRRRLDTACIAQPCELPAAVRCER